MHSQILEWGDGHKCVRDSPLGLTPTHKGDNLEWFCLTNLGTPFPFGEMRITWRAHRIAVKMNVNRPASIAQTRGNSDHKLILPQCGKEAANDWGRKIRYTASTGMRLAGLESRILGVLPYLLLPSSCKHHWGWGWGQRKHNVKIHLAVS